MADDLDLKILEKLDENIRAGSKQIAKQIGTHRQVVDYRIKRMEKNGTIINYRMLGNLSKMGFSCYHRVHIKLFTLSKKQRQEILLFLEEHKKTVWVIETEGRYDLATGVISNNVYEFQNILFSLLKKYSSFISYFDHVRVLEIIVPSRDFRGKRKQRKVKGAIVEQVSQEKITVLGKKIINELAKNGRQTALSIAKKVGASAEVTNYHIKKIMKKGLLFSNIQFGYKEFNFELYKTLIQVKNPQRERIEAFKSFARTYPRVWDLVETQGKWQLELDIESHGHEDYYHILEKIKEKFADLIESYETLYIRKERKFLFSVFSEPIPSPI